MVLITTSIIQFHVLLFGIFGSFFQHSCMGASAALKRTKEREKVEFDTSDKAFM